MNKRKTSQRDRSSKQKSLLDVLDEETRRAYAAVSAMEPQYKIACWFPHEQQDLQMASPMGWYTQGIHEASRIVLLASTFPADIREIFTPLPMVIGFRQKGFIWPALIPIQTDSLDEVVRYFPSQFQIFFSTSAAVADKVDAVRGALPFPTLHASSVKGAGRTPFESLTANQTIPLLAAHFRRVLDVMAESANDADFVRQARTAISGSPLRRLTKHPLAVGHHNLTSPNEFALAAFGWKFTRQDAISAPITDPEEGRVQRYVARICAAADAVFDARAALTARLPSRLVDSRYVLAVASMYWGYFKNWRNFPKEMDAPDAREQLKKALADTVQAVTYFGSVEVDENRRPSAGPLYMLIRTLYARDMAAFTAALTMLSTATLCPVLRLEPRLNQIRGELKILGHCVREESSHRFDWKTSRLVAALGDKMRTLIDPEFLARIDAVEPLGFIEGMKLVSDLPLELLPTNGMPLALRYDVSRLPPVPGNLFWQACMAQPMMLPLSAFDEVLIVRSFAATDPLRDLLETSFQSMVKPGRVRRVGYRFVDVQTEDEFVAAVQSAKGAVLIFDGHGRYDDQLGMGTLVVGGKSLNVWDLKKTLTFPPIVMFSACDTQPIDGSHSSVATAAFALGARAVLGTLFKVNGIAAAIFCARMLLRLDQFLDASVTARSHVTWREVVSGMLRMAYVNEVARQLNTVCKLGLSELRLGRIQLKTNTAINARDASWHDVFLDELAKATRRDRQEVVTAIRQYCGLPDALKYVQLGTPERIVIVREDPRETFSRDVQAWEASNGGPPALA